MRLYWTAATHTLRVYWDGVERLQYTNGTIEGDIFNNSSSVWFGVVGSTGGAYNLQQFRSVVDASTLSVTKSVTPTAIQPGDPLTYTIEFQNNSSITAFVTEIEDQLPAGVSYIAGTTAGLTSDDPVSSGSVLSWTGEWILNPGESATLTFQAQGPTVSGIYLNTTVIRGANFFEVSSGATAAVTVGSDLSTSTKTVSDINGGDPEPGDVLRYTITLNETAGLDASGVSVNDDLPSNVINFNMVSMPSGAVNASTGTGTGVQRHR